MANKSPTAPRPASEDATSSAKPVASHRFGRVSAAIFTNQVKSKDGTTREAHSVSLRRSYRTAEGKWEHTHTLQPSDLLPAALALEECYKSIQGADASEDE